ncbi:MAG: hypothetical protein JOZ80_10475 [Acidobacteriaceae bacterium]|nr:hypothetical protein [Acidobacteriaceae bacterium]
MQIALHSSARKFAFLAGCVILCTAYLSLCTREFVAAHFAEKPVLGSLEKAAALQPMNANYRHILGRYHLFVDQDPAAAVRFIESAISLNPYNAIYWLDLSTAYQLLGEKEKEISAVEKALATDPRTPEIAWQAANRLWAEGKLDNALHEFGVVAENDPYLMGASLERCWRIRPDVSSLLATVLPRRADVYSSFLEFLISQNQPTAAALTWAQVAQLHAPVSTRYVFEYIRFLTGQKEIDQARRVWKDAANLSDLSAYQPSPRNLLVNGDFSSPVLNGGFDWLYENVAGVSLAIDPTENHSAQQSLSIEFNSGGLEDAGIRQLVPVEPNTDYEFSAFFKSENIEGAGGPRLALQDAFSGTRYFESEDLKDADFWKDVNGTFTTASDTKLLVVRIARVPANNAIRGRLWLDGVRLIEHTRVAGGE